MGALFSKLRIAGSASVQCNNNNMACYIQVMIDGGLLALRQLGLIIQRRVWLGREHDSRRLGKIAIIRAQHDPVAPVGAVPLI